MKLLPQRNHYFDEEQTINNCPACDESLIVETHSTLLSVKSDWDEGQFVTNVPTTKVCPSCPVVVFDKEKLAQAASLCLLKGKGKDITYTVVGLVDLSAEAALESDQSVLVPEPPSPRVVGQKTGRNESCPCGSGKKYKKCCLKKKE